MKCGLSTSVKITLLISAALAVIAFILQIVGFSSPKWWVGPGGGRSPFLSIGWHSACFENCIFPYCPAGDFTIEYDGCYKWSFNEWIWDDDRMKEIKNWLMPDWYNNIKIVIIVAIPIAFFGVAMLVLCAILSLGENYTTGKKPKDTLATILLFLAAIFMLGAGVTLVIALAWFSLETTRQDYMPMPEKNHLGYSYWVTVGAAAVYILSFISTSIAAVCKIVRSGIQKDPRYSEEMMLGR